MARKVELGPPRFKPLRVKSAQVQKLFRWLDAQPEFSVPPGEISVAFLNEVDLAKVHDDFLDDPSPTDVITFPGDPDEDFAGEILVSAERAANEAPKHSHTFAEELTLYLVHGWLHLAGLDDLEETNRPTMRAAEKLLMDRARAEGVVPEFSLVD